MSTVTVPEVSNGVLPVSAIKADFALLRGVKKESAEFVELRENIRANGVLTAVSVFADEDNGCYQLMDGLQRYTAAADIAAEDGEDRTIPVSVIPRPETKTDLLTQQISANHSRVKTRPVEFARACAAILAENPAMTRQDLAQRVGYSPEWVDKTMKLQRLCPAAEELINGGDMTVANAVALADLPAAAQENYIADAQTDTSDEFASKVSAAKNAMRADAKAGGQAEFTATPKLRTKADIQKAIEDNSALKSIVGASDSPIAGASAALSWALSLDDATLTAKKAAWEADQKARNDKKAKREAAKGARKQTQDIVNKATPEELAKIREMLGAG